MNNSYETQSTRIFNIRFRRFGSNMIYRGFLKLRETKTELHDVCFINSINPIPRTVFDTHWQLNK